MVAIAIQENDKQLAIRLLDATLRRYPLSLASSVALSMLIVAALWPLVSHRVLLVWQMLLVLVMALRYFGARRYLGMGQETSLELGKWQASVVAGSAAAGYCWGGALFFIPASPHDSVALTLLFAIAGTSAFASVSLAAIPLAAAAFLASALVPTALWLFTFGERLHDFMGVITLLYLALMQGVSREIYRAVRNSLSLSDENKELTEAQRQSNLRMSNFFEIAPGFFYTACMDAEGKSCMPFASTGIQELFGVTPGEVADSSAPLFALVHADDIESIVMARESSRRNMTPFHVEFRINHREAGERWIELHSQPQRESDGSTRWHGFMQDITGRKRLEGELTRHEVEFRTLAANLPVAVIRYDAEQRRRYINPAAERMLHGDARQMLGQVPGEGGVPATVEMIGYYRRKMAEVLASGVVREFDFAMDALPTERLEQYEVRMAPEYGADGKIVGTLTTWFDVTERKRIEEELRLKEQVLDQAHEGIYLIDEQARFVYVNDEACRALGYSREELLGMGVHDIDLAYSVEDSNAVGRKSKEEGAFTFETQHRRRDGSLFPVEIQASALMHRGKHLGLALARDITERKDVQRRLEMLDIAVNQASDALFVQDESLRFISVNDAACRALGYSREELSRMSTPDIDPDFSREMVEHLFATAELGKSACFETRHRTKDGRIIPVELTGAFFEINGVRHVVTMARDITERRRAEAALAAREREFRTLAENFPDIVIRYDMDCRRIYANPALAELAGCQLGELIGATPQTATPLIDPKGYIAELRKVMRSGSVSMLEISARRVDGELAWYSGSFVPEFDSEGNVVGVLMVARDITGRKHAEAELAKERATLRTFFCALPDLAWMKDAEGRYLACNPRLEQLYGRTEAEVLGKTDFDFVDAELAAFFRKKDMEAAAAGKPCVNEEWVTFASDGRRALMETVKSPVFDVEGKVVGVIGVAHDITERKQMEESLRRSGQLMRTVVDSTPDWIFIKDREHRYCLANKGYADALHISPEDFIGKNDLDLGFPEELVKGDPEKGIRGFWTDDRLVLEKNETQVYPDDPATIAGEVHTFHTIKVPLRDDDGKPWGVLAFARDISERKKTEALLKEKFERIVELNTHLEENARTLEEQAVELEASQEHLKDALEFSNGVISAIPDTLFEMDRNGRYLNVWTQNLAVLAEQRAALIGKTLHEILPEEIAAMAMSAIREADERGLAYGHTIPIVQTDGETRWYELSLARKRGSSVGNPTFIVLSRDVTQRRRMEDDLAIREQEFRTLLENTPDVIVRYDRECRRTYVNPAWEKANGISRETVLGKSPAEVSVRVKPIAANFECMLREVMASGQSSGMDLVWRNEAGEQICFALSAIPEFGRDGEIASVLTVARDISERKRMEESLAERERELRTLVENAPDSIARYDSQCRRLYVNPAFAAMVEGGVAALLGKTPSECPGGKNAAVYERKIAEVFLAGKDVEFELAWADKGGRELCTHVHLTPERDAEGRIVSVLGVGRDITELNAYRKKIHQMAFYDALTSLPNRALFNDRLRQMLADASWHGQLAGVMLLDLDRFKAVNDTLGHSAGDELLRESAVRLMACVRSYDTVARLGGDEFAILLPDVRSGDDLGGIAGKILQTFATPFLLEGKEVFVSTSIGIVLYPDDGLEAEDLLKHADSAMYYAKRSGRNNFRFYSRELTASANERLTLEGDLRRGFGRGELALHFQPKVSLSDGAVVGSEALLRWFHPERGMVPPDKFIPIAEDSGLIVEIGAWVLENGCRVATEWNAPGRPLHKVAINLSARQFQSGDLVALVRDTFDRTGCRAEWIELEITESLLLDEDGEVLEMLQAFRQMGISIAIDDFGTGYSSLSYLARFPIDTLKIDRSFIRKLTEYGHQMELVKGIVSIAQCLDQQVVAEGVECAEEAGILRGLGCHFVQGYFYGKPMPKAQFEEFSASFVATAFVDAIFRQTQNGLPR